jgi:hypothetical protein
MKLVLKRQDTFNETFYKTFVYVCVRACVHVTIVQKTLLLKYVSPFQFSTVNEDMK